MQHHQGYEQIAGARMRQSPESKQVDVGYFTLTGEVNSDVVRRVFDGLSLFSREKLRTVHILLQSNGGYVSDGICLYNTLRHAPIDLVMYNAGAVASIGIIVFLAAEQRVASDTARFMIHKSHATAPTGAGPEALKIIAEGLMADDRRTEAILQRHVSLPQSMWGVYAGSDLHVASEEALSIGLISRIGHFAPPHGQIVHPI